MLQAWRKRLALYKFCSSSWENFPSKCYSSALRGILVVGSQGIQQSHGEQQILCKRFIGRETPRRMAAPAWLRSSRELGRMQDLCRGSGEGGLGLEGLCGLILWQHWLATLDSGGCQSSLGVEPGSCRSPGGACKGNLCPRQGIANS